MFQYALGRSLELKHGVEVKYDITYFKTYFKQYILEEIFNINPAYATEEEIYRLKNFNPREHFLLRKFPRFIRRNFETYKQEDNAPFDARFSQWKNNKYLEGYWQSENYFKNIKGTLRKEFIVI
jgi:hypothetical protein